MLEYLKDLNATKSAIRAGYSPKGAEVTGCQLLRNPKVAIAVQEAIAHRAKRSEIEADRVLEEIAHAAFLDPAEMFAANGTVKSIHEIPEDVRRAIASFEVIELFDGKGKEKVWTGYLKKVKMVSKEGTLDLAGRHLGLFPNKVELTGKDGGPIMVANVDLSLLNNEEVDQLTALVAKATSQDKPKA